MDALLVLLGAAMLAALLLLSVSARRDDLRMRSRWDAKFDREARDTRRTDATGVLMCRRCGASGSESAGVCPGCGAAL